MFRLPLALGVPWGCWGCLGASVLAQGVPQGLNPREVTGLISELLPGAWGRGVGCTAHSRGAFQGEESTALDDKIELGLSE